MDRHCSDCREYWLTGKHADWCMHNPRNVDRMNYMNAQDVALYHLIVELRKDVESLREQLRDD